MGETTAKLRLVFEAIAETRGVYLFDEFDALGSQRGTGNDIRVPAEPWRVPQAPQSERAR